MGRASSQPGLPAPFLSPGESRPALAQEYLGSAAPWGWRKRLTLCMLNSCFYLVSSVFKSRQREC